MRFRFHQVLPSLAAGLIVLPGAALAVHAHLTGSFPGKDEVVAEAPTEIRLTFSEKVELAISSIKVLGADSAEVRMGKAARTDDTLTIAAPVLGALAPGEYAVVWRTASRDGHPIRGRYTFTVTAPAKAEPARSRPAEPGDPARR